MSTHAQRINNRHDKIWANARLHQSIVDQILEVAALYDEVTTSDLQGMVDVIAAKIIVQVRAVPKGT